MSDIQIQRLKRKLAEKDRKIAGLRRELEATKLQLGLSGIYTKHDVVSLIQNVLVNTRLTPMPVTNLDRLGRVKIELEQKK